MNHLLRTSSRMDSAASPTYWTSSFLTPISVRVWASNSTILVICSSLRPIFLWASRMSWKITVILYLSGVLVRSSKSHGKEMFLSLSLFFHVSIFEKILHHWVNEHLVIEFVDSSIESSLASQLIVQGLVVHDEWRFF